MKDVANILGVTYRTIQKYKQEGRLNFVKIGKNYRINEEDLKAFLKGDE